MLGLELVDNLVEAPREGEHVGMLLLLELGIDAESGILRRKV